MGHISPSFRRAYCAAKRQRFGRESLRAGQGTGAVSAWRALGWQAKALLGVAGAALLVFVLAPAEAASNSQDSSAPAPQPAAFTEAEIIETAPPAPIPASAEISRPVARPAGLATPAPPPPPP
ncbi:MAG: hypothetical protein Q4G26_04720, partial [Paracoccus sp. (in: a-proteobacteria)]|nr:hypothetical protein [Paracoccus sp. (in: a-proteobacteria)]